MREGAIALPLGVVAIGAQGEKKIKQTCYFFFAGLLSLDSLAGSLDDLDSFEDESFAALSFLSLSDFSDFPLSDFSELSFSPLSEPLFSGVSPSAVFPA